MARKPSRHRTTARRKPGPKIAPLRRKRPTIRRRPAARKKTAPKRKPAAKPKPRSKARKTPKPKRRRARTRRAAPPPKAPRQAAPKAARKTSPARPRRTAPARPRVPPSLNRERRRLTEEPEPPSAVAIADAERYVGAALTGQDELVVKLLEHTETGPGLTGGDIDGDWEHAYSTGDEAPGGDNPTPDQAGVDENARALGIHYDDAEELRLGDKEAERDRHRWEFDPASAEDYRERK